MIKSITPPCKWFPAFYAPIVYPGLLISFFNFQGSRLRDGLGGAEDEEEEPELDVKEVYLDFKQKHWFDIYMKVVSACSERVEVRHWSSG